MKNIALFDVVRDGAGYAGHDAFDLVASSDEWLSPVVSEVGPDGAVWFSDWQNYIIQHNPTPNPERGGYAAKTGVGVADGFFADFDRRAAIADREIEAAIGSESETVEIVADKIETNAVAVGERFFYIGNTVTVRVFQGPEIRDIRVIDVSFARQDAGGEAIERVIEAVGENFGVVDFAVAVGVEKNAETIGVFGVGIEIANVAFQHCVTIVHGAGGEIFIEPIHVAANVGDAGVEAEGFGEVNAAAFVDVEGDDVGGVGFGSDEFGFEPGREFEGTNGILAFVGGGGDFRLASLGSRGEFGSKR
jgi:hypothetical protein